MKMTQRRSPVPITLSSDTYPTNRQTRQPPAVEPIGESVFSPKPEAIGPYISESP
ncbi:hypothetical protein [Laspinema olomoucense]|uniref:hypothetical protein n=1 Tax=Laspinema olomoucense TaxID=3231600 RepID=UPI0021BB34CC|nr:hypothetical protein [Laspinema sp. D3d]MCT7975229.1 hypothetical protein [Laspinema sp. D3d]